MTETHDPLLKYRSEFPISETTSYLISNSLGAMPKSTRDSMTEYVDSWQTRGVRAWGDQWWNLQFEVAGDVEKILGVAPETVSMHQNVAMASQSILSCFDFKGARNKVVFSDLHFPSVMYLLEGLAARGAEIARVPAASDGLSVDLQQMLDAIDEQTSVVGISHVLFRSGFIQDAKAIAAKCREVGAFLILDVFQSVGSVPLKLADWGVHAAVGGALKYMCGGPGNCFLYVDPAEIQKLKPAFTGWMAHKDPFAFSPDGQDYRTDGGRFLNGTPNVPALYAGRKGIATIAEIGVEAIRQKSIGITTKMVARCDELGIKILSPRDIETRGNHLSLDIPDGYAVCRLLCDEDIVCDYRPSAGIRYSPHFYTTEAESMAAINRIAEILENNEHARYLDVERKPG